MSDLISRKTPFLPRAAAISLAGAATSLAVSVALHAALPALHPLDLSLQLRIHALSTPTLDRLMLTLTAMGAIGTFTPALAAVLLVLLAKGHRYTPAVLAYAVTGAFLLNETLKLLFHRPRPTLPWSIGDEHTFSFPSGHAFFSVVLYGTLCLLALRRGTPAWRVVPLALTLPFAIGTSRIYLGEHYATDVLAGWLCGAVWTTTTALISQKAGDPPSRS